MRTKAGTKLPGRERGVVSLIFVSRVLRLIDECPRSPSVSKVGSWKLDLWAYR